MEIRRLITEWATRRRMTVTVAMIVMVVLLAMTWTGNTSWSSSTPSDVSKLPAVRTIGTEDPAYQLTPLEREKLGSSPVKSERLDVPIVSSPVIWKKQSISTIELIPRDPGPEGLTPAERAKRTH